MGSIQRPEVPRLSLILESTTIQRQPQRQRGKDCKKRKNIGVPYSAHDADLGMSRGATDGNRMVREEALSERLMRPTIQAGRQKPVVFKKK